MLNLQESISKVRNGDNDAFTQLYRELQLPVYTIAWRILQSREAAEDVTQDVFLKLFCAPPDSSVRNPRAWIFQMTRNLSIDTLRKRQRETENGTFSGAEDEFDRAVTRINVENAIGRLSCIQREILTLHLNVELPFHEISRIVGLSVPAVYRRYRSALKCLREYLEEEN